MFNSEYYIQEKKYYIDINASDPYTVVNTVDWIENADFNVIIQGDAYDIVSYEPPALLPQVIAAPQDLISYSFTIYDEDSFPQTVEDLPDNTPLAEIYYGFETDEAEFPVPRDNIWSSPFYNNGIYTNFCIYGHSFPIITGIPDNLCFNLDGIYSPFKFIRDITMFPTTCPENPPVLNKNIYELTPNLIGETLSVSGRIKILNQNDNSISTNTITKKVVDRDSSLYKNAYQNFVDRYFNEKENKE